MKNTYSIILYLVLAISSLYAQDGDLPINKIDIWSDNSSYDGIQGQAYIHMHNRKGIRIEYNIHRKKLELWISPLAGKSISYTDRNFSNRDDFTRIFDNIAFPELSYKDFIKCDYDPFHSVLHFKNNRLHIVSLYDKAVVAVWFDEPSTVDFKTDKQDELLRASGKNLVSKHPDRNKILTFGAILGDGNGKFTHQKIYDSSRSFYSRASVSANQVIYIGGDDISENIPKILAQIASQNITQYLKSDLDKIQTAVSTGTIKVRSNPELQKLIDLNKKVLLSMKDESGAERAALRYIYYLIWHRDGAMSNAYSAYTGWTWPLEKWTQFELANPTVEKKGSKTERFFGQLVNEKITKREEDGPFYGIWSAFTYWTQTGNTQFNNSESIKVLEDNMSWWENNFYDPQRGLFGRYHYCEATLYGSDGDGFDDATGNPTGQNISKYKNDTIVKSFDLYMNNIVYSSYLMLSAMEKGEKSTEYLEKARKLGIKIGKFYNQTTLPSYGDLINTQYKTIAAQAYGMDEADYIWGNSVPFFYAEMSLQPMISEIIYEDQMKSPKGHFFPDWFSNIAAMDPELHDEQKMIKAIEYVIPQCVKPGKCLPMPYTICEIVDVEDCSIYHDVRPQAFSISAMFGAIGNLGVKRLPFGLAIRGTSYLESIEKYSYQQSEINFSFKGLGSKIKSIKINGKLLVGTYQIPEMVLASGANKVEIFTDKNIKIEPVLISSTVKLLNIDKKNYQIDAFGKNVLMFKNLAQKITIKDLNEKNIAFTLKNIKGVSYVEFEGVGKFIVSL